MSCQAGREKYAGGVGLFGYLPTLKLHWMAVLLCLHHFHQSAAIDNVGLGNASVDSFFVTGADGKVIGATVNGGQHNDGTVFEIDGKTRKYRILASFDATTGISPSGESFTVDAHGNLFGTTTNGGPANAGVIFELPWLGSRYGKLTVLAPFNGSNGAYGSSSLLLDKQGDIFGVTGGGGKYGKGDVYELRAGSHHIAALFSFNGHNGDLPSPLLSLRNNALIGTTAFGGRGYNGHPFSGKGTVFVVPNIEAPSVTTMSFTDTTITGWEPNDGVVINADKDIIGTVPGGGKHDKGTVYELKSGSRQIQPLISFDGRDGAYPGGPITEDAKGDLYGVTDKGGSSNLGVIYKLPWHGNGYGGLQVLASFNGSNSTFASSSLLLDKQGDIFGVTSGGGRYGKGDVYELRAGSHRITALFSFNGRNGALPAGRLTQDAQGNLYGATASKGLGYPAISGLGEAFVLAK